MSTACPWCILTALLGFVTTRCTRLFSRRSERLCESPECRSFWISKQPNGRDGMIYPPGVDVIAILLSFCSTWAITRSRNKHFKLRFLARHLFPCLLCKTCGTCANTEPRSKLPLIFRPLRRVVVVGNGARLNTLIKQWYISRNNTTKL